MAEARGEHSIADVLRESIRQRMLPPGMPLIQQSIADALGVSRIPVREALQRLASEGLVTFGEDGARVTELTAAEIDELWSLRAVLESSLADAIVANITRTEIEDLARLVREMDSAPDTDAWSNLNYAFHDGLYVAAGRPHYRAAALRVLTLIEPYSRVAAGLLEQQSRAQEEHRQMLAALEAADAGRLRELLERHSLRAKEALVGYARAESSGSGTAATADAARRLARRLVES